MYRLYKEKCTQNDVPFVKQHTYQEVFNTKFNISFFKPKKDLCSICEAFKNMSDNEKADKQVEIEKHNKEKVLSRIEKEIDKKLAIDNDKILLSVFDLQAVTPLPNGNVSSFYYKSKLNVFNFTAYNIVDKTGYCYMWHEGEARRGANEIATCIFKYIEEYGIGKQILFYSDNCSAQNKNKFLVSMYLYAIQNLDVDQIVHKYLIVGHTENEGDSMHSCIEKEKSRILKSGPIYVPSEIVTIAKSAKKKGSPYFVTEMATENFVDWKKINALMGKNFTINENGGKVVWTEIKIMMVKKEEPKKIFYKTSYTDKEFLIIDIDKKKRRTKSEDYNISLFPAYTEPPTIPANKHKDLISLCKDNLIPKKHQHFFMSLKASNNNNNDSDSK